MSFFIDSWLATADFPLLSSIMLVPLLTMLIVIWIPSSRYMWRVAYSGSTITLLLSSYLLMVFDAEKSGMHFVEELRFFALSYRVGVDGINILFIPLTAVVSFLLLTYASVTQRKINKQYLACLLAYETILLGAFTAINIMQFWLWSLLELIPVVLLTINAGTGQNRRWVVTLLVQYWSSGLLMTLAGFLFLAFGLVGSDHALTFDWLTLKENNAYLHDETLIFILLFFGFSIRMPLFPFHGWLPLLAEQGTVVSTLVFLVGLKLGVYALIRFILPLLPGIAEQWQDFVLLIGLISIFYGALLAIIQINIRRLLAFVVLSHTGLLVIGIFCFNEFSLEASLLLAIAYGLASAGMILSVGLVYEQTSTAFMPRLGGLFDNNSTIALFFLLAALSTTIMPGMPAFDASRLLIQGIIEEKGWLITLIILLGNIMTAMVLLYSFQKIFIASSKRMGHIRRIEYARVKKRLLVLTIGLILVGTGFYTTPWLKLISYDAQEMTKNFPLHSSQLSNRKPAQNELPSNFQ